MNYQEAISFLQSFPDSERGSKDLKPERNLKMPLSSMLAFLKSIGNPQNFTKTIHITGSKGKGSTATFITAILQAAGFRTALFTSPHMHSYTERIAFNLQPISEDLFAKGVSELQPFIESFEKQGNTFSTFGIITALFFHLVKNVNPPMDWQIVEVGLGGKDDLTNVFAKKEAAIITSISLEHTAILGKTKALIAANKAGIITPNCITVVAPQTDNSFEVENVIKAACIQKHSLYVPVIKTSFPYSLKMLGQHQIDNASTATTLAHTLKNQGHQISEQAVNKGLSSVHLPGRFEVLEKNIVLDGAHNGASASALSKTLESSFPGQPIIFILGINQDKNLEDIYSALKNKIKTIIATKSDNYRSMPPEEIKKRILFYAPNTSISCTDNTKIALTRAQSLQQTNDVICVCGSFYLVAEARQYLLHSAPSQ
jgi:dihydrofolate synthase/folylpolyglutamate synthase